ncbi:MAG: DUF6223 family protein [Blastocatellia bacterium]
MKMKSILSGLIVVCAACMFLAASCSQASNVRYLIDDARASVDFYTIHLGFAVDLTEGVIGITNGRARAIVAAVVGLISLVVGGLALARSAGRIGTGSGRRGAMVALVVGPIGMALAGLHLATNTGAMGTGSGRLGAIVALVVGLIGIALGGLALARSRRTG